MHLVFLNQYYPPDAAPTGVMLAAVVEELAALGHEVTVICAEGGYAEMNKAETPNKEAPAPNPPNTTHRAPSTSHQAPSTTNQEPGSKHILRIGATRFGRGTFVGKLIDYFSYYLGVAWRLAWMRPRPERIVALTTPPYLSVLARAMSKFRGADHAHWVMDLYPDVMVAHGMLREGGGAHRLLAGLARWGFGGKRCAALLTLGPDMAERVEALKAKGPKTDPAPPPKPNEPSTKHQEPSTCQRHQEPGTHWIPLWSGGGDGAEGEGTALAARRREMGWVENELVVMYSGNMGLGHRFGEILEVIGMTPEAGAGEPGAGCEGQVRFVFFGGGKRRGEIADFMARHPDAPVELHDYAPAAILADHLRSADVHLASLDESWTGTMVPSKLQGIFAVSRPVIFIGDAGSSIGRWVIGSGGGWVVKPGDGAGLAAALDEARDPQLRESRGRAAGQFGAEHFDRETNVRRVAGLFVRSSAAAEPVGDL